MIANRYADLDPHSYHYHRDVTRRKKMGMARKVINLRAIDDDDATPIERLKAAIVTRMILDAGLSRREYTGKARQIMRSYCAGIMESLRDAMDPDRVAEVLDFWEIDLPVEYVMRLARNDYRERKAAKHERENA